MPRDSKIDYGIYSKDNIYKEILSLLESDYSFIKTDKNDYFLIRKWKNYEIRGRVVNGKTASFEMDFFDNDTMYLATFQLKFGFTSEKLETRIRKLNKVKVLIKNIDRIQSIVDKAYLFDRFLDGWGLMSIEDIDRRLVITCTSRMVISGPYEKRNCNFVFRFNHAPGIENKETSYDDMLKIETSKQFFAFAGIENG